MAGTILGYDYHVAAVTAILISSFLGIAVSLSTFLFIGATSSLTYNIIGHIKTVIILTGGCLLFDDVMSWKRLGGICVAMCGIIWYSHLNMMSTPPKPITSKPVVLDAKVKDLQGATLP